MLMNIFCVCRVVLQRMFSTPHDKFSGNAFGLFFLNMCIHVYTCMNYLRSYNINIYVEVEYRKVEQ